MKRDAPSAPLWPPYYNKGLRTDAPVWWWIFWAVRNPHGLVDGYSHRGWRVSRIHKVRPALVLEASRLPWGTP